MDPHTSYGARIGNHSEAKKQNSGDGGGNQVFYQQQQPSTSGYPQQSTQRDLTGADDLNDDFMDFFDTAPSSSSDHLIPHHRRMDERERLEAAKKADEDLQTLMDSTSDMKEIQQQILLEQNDMEDKYREERSRQRRAAAARSRYQRMSENERRQYNHRRRMRQLGLDPEQEGPEVPNVRDHVRQANAKKAEAARLRYHRMTPEQKRDYNMRRTEAFRRRRQEEEMLLSTPAGRISAEALAKAQQIMVRNARKAESARLRYQKMTPEERKQYNMKRAAAKKNRKLKSDGDNGDEEGDLTLLDESGEDPYHYDMADDDDGHDSESEVHVDIEDTSVPVEIENGSILDEIVDADDETSKDHMLNVINEVAHPRELGIFTRMENEVIRRTRIANATIQKQHSNAISAISGLMAHAIANNSMTMSSNAIVGGIQYDMAPSTSAAVDDPVSVMNSPVPMADDTQSEEVNCRESSSCISGSSSSQQDKTHVIDEKALHDMVETGRDANGLPVEIRTCDGTRITSIEDLINISHGQTVLITQQHIERKGGDFNLACSSSGDPTEGVLQYDTDATGGDYEECEEDLSPEEQKVQMTRARRAERARARYHRMSQDQRREQNAKRALTLRKSRARDDQLCQLAERMRPDQLDEATRKAIHDAQQRRSRRAEQARTKYHKMNSEQRRKYNAARDAQRKMRKSEQEAKDAAVLNAMHHYTSGAGGPNTISVELDEKPNILDAPPTASLSSSNIPTYSQDGSDFYTYALT